MAEYESESDAEENLTDVEMVRPQSLQFNPVNVGLPAADGVLSPNNPRIVHRSEHSSNLTLRAKNDPLKSECSAEELPENHFGNGNDCRKATTRRTTSVESIATSNGSPSLLSSPNMAVAPSADCEPTTDEVLQSGLGLILHDKVQATTPQDSANGVQPSPIHNWQSSKHSIKSRLQYLLNTGALSDVTFLVGGSSLLMTSSSSVVPMVQRFVAHKFVLSMSSAVFNAMFNGQMAQMAVEDEAAIDEAAIEIPDVEPIAFQSMLSFIYTDEINVESETVMSILYTAKKYALPRLEDECVEFLKDNIQCENVFMLLTQARLFDEPVLEKMCLHSIDKCTTEAFSSDGFVDIDLETLCVVLERDSLGIRESKLFSAVTKWAEHACLKQDLEISAENQRTVLGKAIRLIRYPLMTVEEFAVQVAQSNILTDSELVELFLYFTVTPKPQISFTITPRCCLTGKEQVVSRFCQVDHRWGYSGTSDRIKFLVTKKIFVAGFGVYGSVHGAAEYSATIEILSADTQRVLGSTDASFSCDGSSSTFRLMFKEPVEILPCVHYIAAITLKGPDSYYGSKGLRKVTHESPTSGKISFQFSYAAGNNNGTSVEDGQIPEIMFYT
ncbi:BTB/POZ domain-containing protein 1-like [Watersipora subatra]|uniref:BTB/POZ domain-containing protein 1-like n=1 Tax=Watersipora subatra TaxID=2589382 RepID=UPI00355B0E30